MILIFRHTHFSRTQIPVLLFISIHTHNIFYSSAPLLLPRIRIISMNFLKKFMTRGHSWVFCFIFLVAFACVYNWGSNLQENQLQLLPHWATQVDFAGPEGNSLWWDVLENRGCNLYEGEWVWDESYPLYESRNCKFLDQEFRCSENQRPNNSYAKWRWQPKKCNLPRFDAITMLEKLRNRRLIFVGDSIGRNQWESLLCMLSSAIADKDSVYEVNGSPITKHIGSLIFKFKSHNCTVEYYRSPFLVQEGRLPAGAPANVQSLLKLDVIDSSSAQWKDGDVLIFNTGNWWNHNKIKIGGCYFQVGDDVNMDMSIEDAYRKSIQTLFDWISREVNLISAMVIFRTYAPVHYRGGNWKTGGRCDFEMQPDISSLSLSSPPWAHLTNPIKEVLSVMDPEMKLDLEIMDVTHMTALRPDGHPSRYYRGPMMGPASLSKQDCSHWCLPGVPDAWNEILYALILSWG